jgi:DNA polymerase III epsilon subunit-like protein
VTGAARGEGGFVAFDTETAVVAPLDRVVEIAAVRFRGEDVVAEFQTLVDPRCPIPEEASAIHGITDEEVRGAPVAPEALKRFFAFAGDAPLVAHHAPFDARVLAGECARAGLLPPANAIFDTLRLARSSVSAASYSLENLVAALGLPRGPHHRALADSHHVVHLFTRLVTSPRAPGALSLERALARHGSPLSFDRFLPERARLPDSLVALSDALARGETITLLYAASGAAPSRAAVTPLFLFGDGGEAYLEALCHRDRFVKTYRLDRIRGLGPAPEPTLFDAP